MRCKQTVLIFLLALVSLSPQTARATLIPAISISRLTEQASLIVVGEVTSTYEEENGAFEFEGGLRKASRMLGVLRVDRVIKGKADGEVSFRFFIPDEFLGYASVQPNQFGTFFFQGTAEDLVFVSAYHPSILAARGGCETRGRDLLRVVAEIDCVLKSPVSTNRELLTAIQYLRTVPAVHAIPPLKAASQGLASPLALLASYILLHHNDISMLPLLEKSLQKSSKLFVEVEGGGTEFNISAALTYIKDEAALPVLSRLMGSSDPQTRRDAAGALRLIGTQAIIGPLSKALHDDDWDVRWMAVIGLASVAGEDEEDDQSWYPSQQAYKDNEQRYLDHWRQWVKQKGIELQMTDKL
jgi:HEAT repeats